MPRKLLIVALVLPLLVIVLGIVRAERHRARSQRWTFQVEGYDPRDLLRGHYIQYRLRLGDAVASAPGAACSDADPKCCLCLASGGSAGAAALLSRELCATARDRCDGILGTRHLARMQRYYVPEARAYELDAKFRDAVGTEDAQLVVAIDHEGTPQIEALLIRGVRVEQLPKR